VALGELRREEHLCVVSGINGEALLREKLRRLRLFIRDWGFGW
jgi:hypothetical protein